MGSIPCRALASALVAMASAAAEAPAQAVANASSAATASSSADGGSQRPWLDYVIVIVPLWWCLASAYKMYWRVFTGGIAGKRNVPLFEAAASTENIRVFMDIQIGDREAGRVEFALFAGHYPKTVENFRALCTGELGTLRGRYNLHYKGMKFHRIIPGFMCQGGDCTGDNSIYGGSFPDEWASGYIEHSQEGLLSMANAGRDSQTSQFFITLAPCQHLDGKHVLFGQVTDGMEVVREMGKPGRSKDTPVVVLDCGQL